MIILEIRKLTQTDDLSRAAEILFQADPYIMPDLLGDQKTAGLVGGCLFSEDNNQLFCFDRTLVAVLNGQIQGILCYRTDVCRWDEQHLRNAFLENGLALPEMFDRVNREYFDKIAREQLPENSAECMFLAVAQERRGSGIGSCLLEQWSLGGKDAYYLDVLESNELAITLYKRYGFEVIHKHYAYPCSMKKACLTLCFVKQNLYKMQNYMRRRK